MGNVTPAIANVQEFESQNRRDDEFRKTATTCNTRNITKYRVFTKYTDELAYADVKIRIQVFGKSLLTILLNCQLSMRNRYETETHGR
jgi:hypothetical protein